MREVPYYVVTMLAVQLGFITTLLYVVPQIMHGIFRSFIFAIFHWVLYIGFAWTRAWPFLAGILVLWLRVTTLAIYFMHEAWTLHDMGRHHTRPEPTRDRGVPLTF